MEKLVTCTKCKATFKVAGPRTGAKEVDHGISCPHCGELNEVLWPMDAGWTTVPPKK